QNLFIFCEVAWAAVSLALTWFCVGRFGLSGAGIAFFLSYVFHGLLLYPIVRRLSGFRWSRDNAVTGTLFLSIIAIVFSSFYWLSKPAAVAIGCLAVLFTTAYSVRLLLILMQHNQLPRPLRKLAALCGAVE
ncbi:MAG TPA: polysaccharide biosynthesis C-terminal domain-containing protein, partial [Terriglobales bacterium]|nr:polysaccharide biosynthesis C-terminal domain-containing protein [Terriglobales bacterium]